MIAKFDVSRICTKPKNENIEPYVRKISRQAPGGEYGETCYYGVPRTSLREKLVPVELGKNKLMKYINAPPNIEIRQC